MKKSQIIKTYASRLLQEQFYIESLKKTNFTVLKVFG